MSLFKKKSDSAKKENSPEEFSLFKSSKRSASDTSEAPKSKKIVIGDVQDVEAPVEEASSGPVTVASAESPPLNQSDSAPSFSGVFKSRKKQETGSVKSESAEGASSSRVDDSASTADTGLKFKTRKKETSTAAPSSGSAKSSAKSVKKIPLLSVLLLVIAGGLAIGERSMQQDIAASRAAETTLNTEIASLTKQMESPKVAKYLQGASILNWDSILDMYSAGGHPNVSATAVIVAGSQEYKFNYSLKQEAAAYDFTTYSNQNLPFMHAPYASKCAAKTTLPEGSSHEFIIKATCTFN